MAPKGPMLPRKNRTAAQARKSLRNSAFQVGVFLAIERNRCGMRQEDLAAAVGCSQGDISDIEQGYRPPKRPSDAQLKRLFKVLKVSNQVELREFLKWWHTHGPK